MIKICCLSDVHNFLPEVPNCDLLILGGDYVAEARDDFFGQARFLNGPFLEWLWVIERRGIKIVGVWGNHEVVADKAPYLLCDAVLGRSALSPWRLLQNSGVEALGLRLWGTPYSREYGQGWGFNASEERLSRMYETVSADTDIVISHGPAFGFGDKVDTGKNVGNPYLAERIIKDYQPSLLCVGHIHSGKGIYKCGKTTIVNASYVGEDYTPHTTPIITINI